MLSSLAKYFFGRIMDDTPDPAVECETKEVNDWLLINLPNQPSQDMDFDFNDEDDDDILSALPLLWTLETPVCDKQNPEDDELTKSMDLCLDTRQATQSALISECLEDFQILPEALYLNQSHYYPSDFSVVVSQHFNGLSCHTVRNPDISFFLQEDRKAHNHKCTTVAVKVQDYDEVLKKRLSRTSSCIKNVFVNHRPAVTPPKIALLEQIEELKPSQRAMEYETKKFISRSQLNRQNKNYIFQSSTKTNRRKNLQRNHSGANNNRRCQ